MYDTNFWGFKLIFVDLKERSDAAAVPFFKSVNYPIQSLFNTDHLPTEAAKTPVVAFFFLFEQNQDYNPKYRRKKYAHMRTPVCTPIKKKEMKHIFTTLKPPLPF